MKKISVYEKKQIIKRYCKSKKCTECPLIITAYCQLGDESNKAIHDAYDVLKKNGGRK